LAGAPLAVADVLEPDDPQPARAASALTAIRVIATVVRCFTVTPCSFRAEQGMTQATTRPTLGSTEEQTFV
jgi:hypothetical protein